MAGHALIGPAHLTADSVMAAVFLDVPYLPDLIRSIGKKRPAALLPQKRLGLHRSYSKAKKTLPMVGQAARIHDPQAVIFCEKKDGGILNRTPAHEDGQPDPKPADSKQQKQRKFFLFDPHRQ